MSKSIPFDRAVEIYDDTRGHPPEVAAAIADSVLSVLPARARVVDLGVGTGRTAKPLLARGFRVTGVDLSPKMMRRLLTTLPPGIPAPDLVHADIAAVPLASATFDAVISVHVFHLIADWRAALAEVRRLLKPGGVFLSGHDRRPDDSPSEHLRRKWREIVEARGLTLNQPGVRDFADVQAELKGTGAALDEWRVGRWTRTHTLAHHLETIEHRTWSSTWDIPENVFADCLAELRAWALGQYNSLEAEFSTDYEFVWERYQWQ